MSKREAFEDSETEAAPTHERWRLDKHIPIALIVTILGQGAWIVWWGSAMQHSIQDHERRIVVQETSKTSERMAVVESQLKATQELQLAMDRKLDRILDGQRGVKP